MTEIIIDFTSAAGTTGSTVSGDGTTYTLVNAGASTNTGGAAAPLVPDCPDVAGGATGISFFQTVAPSSADSGSSGVSAPYSGDAAWLDIDATNDIGGRYWFTGIGDSRTVGFGNLDPTKTYRVECFSSRDTTGSRLTDWTIGGTTKSLEAIGNSSNTSIFTGVSPDGSNQILVTSEEGGGDNAFGYQGAIRLVEETATNPILRKGGTQTLDKPAGIGTIAGVTLNGNTITLDSQTVDDFTVTDSDGTITTSGTYDLVATGDTVETISVQVNVYGVVPSNNPLQKDGSALTSLTGVQIRVTDGANINGSQLHYSATATTDASGNLGNIDLSSTAAAVDDSVLLHMLTSAGDSIIAPETVELI